MLKVKYIIAIIKTYYKQGCDVLSIKDGVALNIWYKITFNPIYRMLPFICWIILCFICKSGIVYCGEPSIYDEYPEYFPRDMSGDTLYIDVSSSYSWGGCEFKDVVIFDSRADCYPSLGYAKSSDTEYSGSEYSGNESGDETFSAESVNTPQNTRLPVNSFEPPVVQIDEMQEYYFRQVDAYIQYVGTYHLYAIGTTPSLEFIKASLNFVEQVYETSLWCKNESEMFIINSEYNILIQDLMSLAQESYQNPPVCNNILYLLSSIVSNNIIHVLESQGKHTLDHTLEVLFDATYKKYYNALQLECYNS
jgi:hypothetical protein